MSVEQTTGQSVRAWTATVNGTRLRVEEAGSGSPAVVFSPALWTNKELFAAPMAVLSSDHRCIRYDHRGEGESGLGEPQPPGTLEVEGLYEDALALIDELEVEQCHWIGASVGGFIGVRLAARHPERILSLALIGFSTRRLSTAQMRQVRALTGMVRATRWLGPVGTAVRRLVTTQVMNNMLGPTFMNDASREADRALWRQRFMRTVVPEAVPMLLPVFGHPGNPPELLAEVEAPTLLVSGEDEIAAHFEEDNDLLYALEVMPDARMVTVPGAGHMVLVEQPDAGTAAITDFIEEVEAG